MFPLGLVSASWFGNFHRDTHPRVPRFFLRFRQHPSSPDGGCLGKKITPKWGFTWTKSKTCFFRWKGSLKNKKKLFEKQVFFTKNLMGSYRSFSLVHYHARSPPLGVHQTLWGFTTHTHLVETLKCLESFSFLRDHARSLPLGVHPTHQSRQCPS